MRVSLYGDSNDVKRINHKTRNGQGASLIQRTTLIKRSEVGDELFAVEPDSDFVGDVKHHLTK